MSLIHDFEQMCLPNQKALYAMNQKVTSQRKEFINGDKFIKKAAATQARKKEIVADLKKLRDEYNSLQATKAGLQAVHKSRNPNVPTSSLDFLAVENKIAAIDNRLVAIKKQLAKDGKELEDIKNLENIASDYSKSDPNISYEKGKNVEKYMFDEMKNNLNSESFKNIKSSLDLANSKSLFITSGMKQAALVSAFAEFYEKVKANGEWDHKPKLDDKYLKKDYYIPIEGDKYHEVYYDIWSNIHYGYIGSAAGFDAGTLQTAADVGDKVPILEPFFGKNGPADELSVQIGIDLWEKYGKNLTQEQFHNTILENINKYLDIQVNNPDEYPVVIGKSSTDFNAK